MKTVDYEKMFLEQKIAITKDQEAIAYAYANSAQVHEIAGDNYEKMISGMLYFSFTDDLVRFRDNVNELTQDYMQIRYRHYKSNAEFQKARADHLAKIFGKIGENVFVEGPIFTDYGCNTFIGDDTFINYNFTPVDVALIKIGNSCLIGPNVVICTATHPTNSDLRSSGLENGRAITIEDKVWLGASVTILPGVTIGKGSVIGAGSVVNKDIPPYSIVVGVPAKVIRQIDPEDPDFDKDGAWEYATNL
ncbi:unnamed protein product [Kuraishia capsulata CBS 1993]|uniref:Maltose/galactoside acetyltransferase domain-containing protein n=1 Tax=Kuraishia capsulata CBS 1993 TaxID=1382522 RepID=W6MMR8_9ASCO|nr:uncharacterized protein KUCA_T00003850001 [Kuraishia capsulata CBS 1993]CDK27871.1 unnamed protein product [Kuraishia capsulata CBS 1993]